MAHRTECTQFGYQDLIVDFRGIPVMNKFAPTVLDITHSLQQPNQSGGVTEVGPEHIETLARAGIVSGVHGLFLETHFDPSNAKSDGANMLDIKHLEGLLIRMAQLKTFCQRKAKVVAYHRPGVIGVKFPIRIKTISLRSHPPKPI